MGKCINFVLLIILLFALACLFTFIFVLVEYFIIYFNTSFMYNNLFNNCIILYIERIMYIRYNMYNINVNMFYYDIS